MSTSDDVRIDIEPNSLVEDSDFRRHRRNRRKQRSSGARCSETTRDGRFFHLSETNSQILPVNEPCDGCLFLGEFQGTLIVPVNGPFDEIMFHGESQGAFIFPRGQQNYHSPMTSYLEDEEESEETGALDLDVNDVEEERKLACRICQLISDENGDGGEVDEIVIELGCNCKGDLGTAHRHCAKTWFRMKGNTICEICGATAVNVFAVPEADVAEAAVDELSEYLLDNSSIICACLAVAIMILLLILGFARLLHATSHHDS